MRSAPAALFRKVFKGLPLWLTPPHKLFFHVPRGVDDALDLQRNSLGMVDDMVRPGRPEHHLSSCQIRTHMARSWQPSEHAAVIMDFRYKPIRYRLPGHIRDELPDCIHVFQRLLAQDEGTFQAAFFAAARATARSFLRFAMWA